VTLGASVSALALILSALGSPAPSPTSLPSPAASLGPLKEIGRVRSSPVCSTLHELVGPAIGNVLSVDQTIALGRPILERYAHDVYVLGASASAEMDLMRLENTIGPLVHNLLAAQALLGDPRQFPKQAQNDDERLLLESRDRLKAITKEQQGALNYLNGMLQTAQLGELQRAGADDGLAFAIPDRPTPKTGSGTADTLDAGVAHSPREQADLDFSGATGLGYNPVKAVVADVRAAQTRIARGETDAAASILALARNCAQP
jgi:hypothetical protein